MVGTGSRRERCQAKGEDLVLGGKAKGGRGRESSMGSCGRWRVWEVQRSQKMQMVGKKDSGRGNSIRHFPSPAGRSA